MAQSRRGGPVKPPTLDLKAKESDKTETGSTKDGEKPTESEKNAASADQKGQPASAAATDKKSESTAAPRSETGADKPQATSATKPSDAAEKPKSESSSGAKTGDKPKTPQPARAASANSSGLVVATLFGAVIGIGGAYALASAGYWPTGQSQNLAQTVAANQTDITTLDDHIGALSDRLNQEVATLQQSIADSANTADAGYDDAIASIQTSLSEQSDRLDALSQSAANGETGDVNTQIAALSDQLTQLTQRLETLEGSNSAQQISDLGTKLDDLSQKLQNLEAAQSDLTTKLSDTTTSVADLTNQFQTAEAEREPVTSAIQLPLALSGLETAFASGRPYRGELSALTQAVPSLEIPDVIMTRAANGLPDPDEVARKLETVIPAMLAEKPANPDASWSDKAMEQARNLLALRPADEIEGDTPDALISQLEASVERRSFANAAKALKALPEPMQKAAGDIGADIIALGTAQDFAVTARQAALSEVETAQ